MTTVDRHRIVETLTAVPEVIEDTDLGRWHGLTTSQAVELAPAVEKLIHEALTDVAADLEAVADHEGQWIGPIDPDSLFRKAGRIVRDYSDQNYPVETT